MASDPQTQLPRTRGRTAVVLAALLALAGLVGWLAFGLRGDGGEAEIQPTLRPVQPRALAGTDADAEGPDGLGPVGDGASEREAAREESAVEAGGARPTPGARLTLIGRFVRPDRKPIAPGGAKLILSAAGGEERRIAVDGVERVRIEGLAAVEQRIEIEAHGFVHRAQVLDLGAEARAAERHLADRGTELEHGEDLLLWPAGWIAVRVETPEGRPFGELAPRLGLEPVHLFTVAFDVRARLSAPEGGRLDAPGQEGLVSFHRVPGHRRWRLPDGSAGSLELHVAPPLWVGLWLHGVPLAWELLHPADEAVLFRVAPEDLGARLATLRLRVVADEDGSPVPDARVTLRANHSALRRPDHLERTVAADGRLELTRIVPGSYELTVTRGDSLLPESLLFAPGEVRDLGDLALPLGRALEIEIARADAEPALAFVEVGPYRPEQAADELYPSHRHRSVPPGRTYRLAAPVTPSILRASAVRPGPDGRLDLPYGQSANRLLDPGALPDAPLRLIVHDPRQVAFTLPAGHRADAVRVEVLDHLDLIVARAQLQAARTRDVGLVPGTYRARLVDEHDVALDEIRFEVEDQDLDVRWP